MFIIIFRIVLIYLLIGSLFGIILNIGLSDIERREQRYVSTVKWWILLIYAMVTWPRYIKDMLYGFKMCNNEEEKEKIYLQTLEAIEEGNFFEDQEP